MKSEGRAHWFTPDASDERVSAGDHDVVWTWQYTETYVGDIPDPGEMASKRVRILQRTTDSRVSALPMWRAVGKAMSIPETEVHKLPVPYADIEDGELALRLSDCMNDVDEGFARLDASHFIFCVIDLPLIGGGYRATVMLMRAASARTSMYTDGYTPNGVYVLDRVIGAITVSATTPGHPEYKLADLGISALVLESNEDHPENICAKVTLHNHHVRLFAKNGIIRSYDR